MMGYDLVAVQLWVGSTNPTMSVTKICSAGRSMWAVQETKESDILSGESSNLHHLIPMTVVYRFLQDARVPSV